MLDNHNTKFFTVLISITLLTGLTAAQTTPALEILSGDLNMSGQDLAFGNGSQFEMRYDSGATQFELENKNDNPVLVISDGSTTANFQGSIQGSGTTIWDGTKVPATVVGTGLTDTQVNNALTVSSSGTVNGDALNLTGASDIEVSGSDVVLSTGSVSNGELANSQVSVAGNTVALGSSTGVNLTDLGDVSLSSENAGDVLIYDATNGQYSNAKITAGSGLGSSSGDASFTLNANTGNGIAVNSDNLVVGAYGGLSSNSSGLSVNADGTTVKVSSGTVSVGTVTDGDVSDILTIGTSGTVQAEAIDSESATDGQVLQWNATSGNWEPATDANTDEQVALSSSNTAGYLGTGSDSGVLQTTGHLSYTVSGDSVQLGVADNYVLNSGDTMSGALNMGSNNIDMAGGTLTDTTADLTLSGSPNVDLAGTTLEDGGTVIWDATSGHVPNSSLQFNTVTVAGNTVGLGDSTGIAHSDLSGISSNDHHTRPSTGNGLTGSTTFAVQANGNDLDVSSSGVKIAQQGATADQVLEWNGSAWEPRTDNETTYTAGLGLVLNADTFELKSCSSDKVLAFDGTSWVCRTHYSSTDDGDTDSSNELQDLQTTAGTGDGNDDNVTINGSVGNTITVDDNYIGDSTSHTAGANLDMGGNSVQNAQQVNPSYLNLTEQSGNLATCDSTRAGYIGYNGTHWGCNGSSWKKLY